MGIEPYSYVKALLFLIHLHRYWPGSENVLLSPMMQLNTMHTGKQSFWPFFKYIAISFLPFVAVGIILSNID